MAPMDAGRGQRGRLPARNAGLWSEPNTLRVCWEIVP
jgi:hypothetical protein